MDIEKEQEAVVMSLHSDNSFNVLPNARSKPNEGDRRAPASADGGESRFLVIMEELAGKRYLKLFSGVALFIALFSWPILILIDCPDDPMNQVVDVLMVICMAFFIFEIALDCVRAPKTYFNSFFFWADTAGTVSVVFDINFILGTEGEFMEMRTDVNPTLIRVARVSKIGARAGRLMKVIKLLSMWYRPRTARGSRNMQNLSKKLVTALSAKVAFISILFVLLIPLFSLGQYPEEDLSMAMACERLEEAYAEAIENALASATDTSHYFSAAVQKLVSFYESVDYSPERLSGFSPAVYIDSRQVFVPGQAEMPEQLPNRKASIFRAEISSCSLQRAECRDGDRPYIDFNFLRPRRVEAGCYIALVFFMVLAMAYVSFDLKHTIDRIILKPMSRMLQKVNHLAGNIVDQANHRDDPNRKTLLEKKEHFMKRNSRRISSTGSFVLQMVTKATTSQSQSEKRTFELESDVLEAVVEKLANLAEHLYKMEELQQAMRDMDDTTKGVVVSLMNVSDKDQERKDMLEREQSHLNGRISVRSTSADDPSQHVVLRKTTAGRLATLGTWSLDVLNLEPPELDEAVLSFFFESDLADMTGREWIDIDTFRAFLTKVANSYYDNPYHNFYHAVDVAQTLYTILTKTDCKSWLSVVQTYAILLSAVCHDLSHPGVTNVYLVETQHPLTILHNDKSPLENMHCSRLFEITSLEGSDVFKNMSKSEYKEARKVCIETILHTDFVLHMDMVKDISTIYESKSVICDDQSANTPVLTSAFLEQVLQEHQILWLNLFLHTADISNPCKPFMICQAWAWRVLDEAFEQGDAEKRMEMPVGMLNDRDKINRPGSQHGFIVFLVSPLVVTTVKLFHPLYPLHFQMVQNLKQWRKLWESDAKPAAADVEKRDADVARLEKASEDLAQRSAETPKVEIIPWDGVIRVFKPSGPKRNHAVKTMSV